MEDIFIVEKQLFDVWHGYLNIEAWGKKDDRLK